MAHIDVSASAFPGIAGGANPAATHIKNPPPLLSAMDARRATVAADYIFSPPVNAMGESIHGSNNAEVHPAQAQESVLAQVAAQVAEGQGSATPTSEGTAAHFAPDGDVQAGYGSAPGFGNAGTGDTSAPPVGFAPGSGPALPEGSRSLTGTGAPQFDPFAPQNDSNWGGQYSQPIGSHPTGQFAI